jgi:tetratricopeptide (TPR) repeat protein
MAAMLLGAARVEFGMGPQAEEALRRGLLMDPANATLAAEAGTAMLMQHQPDEVVAITEAAARAPSPTSDSERARLLRVRGVALIDLDRLDEAEQTFRDSLRFEPNSQIARQELDYIAQLRAGGPRRESGGVIQSVPSGPVPPQPGT